MFKYLLSFQSQFYLYIEQVQFRGQTIQESSGNRYQSLNVGFRFEHRASLTLQTTHLAVLMGLGSKLPCASTETCFSRVAPRLASTKSGGRAPAMAHRHDLALLKSSASYFYRGDRHSGREGYKPGFTHHFLCNEDTPD